MNVGMIPSHGTPGERQGEGLHRGRKTRTNGEAAKVASGTAL